MKRWHLLLLLWLVGCTVPSQPPRNVVVPQPTVPVATASLLPSATTRSSTATPQPTASPSASSTTTPRATATNTATSTRTANATGFSATTVVPTASATQVATPTDAALAGMSLCEQSFGSLDGARFSARLQTPVITQTDVVDQITFIFDDVTGSLHGRAGCLTGAQWRQTTQTDALADGMLRVELPDWAHDERLAASPITSTLPVTVASTLTGIAFVLTAEASRGLTIGIGLRQVLPYRIRTERNPERLIIEVQRNAPPEADPLGQAAGQVDPPAGPIFFLQNYDIWRWERGQAGPLVKSDELEFGLALAPDQSALAVCRAPAPTDPLALPYDTRAAVWVLRADGTEARLLADVGGCADLAWSPDGATLAFTANIAPSPPARLTVWTVPVTEGEPVPAAPFDDEWSRSLPQWIAADQLVYRAQNDSGQSLLFLRDAANNERELSAALLTGATYTGVGSFLANSRDSTVAVEALRAEAAGADLVVLRPDGSQVVTIQRGYWQRPLAWSRDGLVYLTTECPSAVEQRYSLRVRRGARDDSVLSGVTGREVGDVVVVGNNLIYSRVSSADTLLRGPAVLPATDAPASVWLTTLDGRDRRVVYEAPVAVTNVQVR